YGIYDPARRELTYACAGHPPARVRRAAGHVCAGLVDGAGLPLGIEDDERYSDATATFRPGDLVLLYTDGITEARNPAGELLGTQRLDAMVASAPPDPQGALNHVLQGVNDFASGQAPADDQTLLVAAVS